MNLASPGTIDERVINIKARLNQWEQNENHTLALNSARAIGCQVVNISSIDLSEGRVRVVLFTVSKAIMSDDEFEKVGLNEAILGRPRVPW